MVHAFRLRGILALEPEAFNLPIRKEWRLPPMACHTRSRQRNAGQDYIDECMNWKVPVPTTVADPLDPDWVNHGNLDWDFLILGDPIELWSWEDENGVCLALPRWRFDDDMDGDLETTEFGVICFGRETGKVCYWDGERNSPLEQGNEFSLLEDFVGGHTLDANAQGVCTACHAGENPFIVHPNEPHFAAMRTLRDIGPHVWAMPIVHASWVGNPGPLEMLGPVPASEGRCDVCHNAIGPAGRFPVLSEGLRDYCDVVLKPSFEGTLVLVADGDDEDDERDPAEVETMPPPSVVTSNMQTHEAWLKAACDTTPDTGTVVPIVFTNPPDELGPPIVGPLYACASGVRVSGVAAKSNVEVKIFVDGIQQDAKTGAPEGYVDFKLVDELEIGQQVSATQTYNGNQSPAGAAEVKDYQDDYPLGIPPPVITPAPLFKCARALSTQNLPGADLIVHKDPFMGTDETHNFLSVATTYTWLGLATAPFEIGDSLSVQQRLCEDISVPSEARIVENAPSMLDELDLQIMAGQPSVGLGNITQGAAVTIAESVIGVLVAPPSVPYNDWSPIGVETQLGSPVLVSHNISARQGLCGILSPQTNVDVAPCDPEQLVPELATPIAGDMFVLVTEAVLGTTIHIFDKDDVQIGGGSGYVIGLSRPLVGDEVIRAVAELSGCLGEVAFQITVFDPS